MAPKHAQFFTYGNDGRCHETKDFIEEAGVLLQVRDLEKQPLSYAELDKLIGHVKIDHFLDKLSDGYRKHRFHDGLPEREEVLRLLAEDNSMLRKPIIKTVRLLTVGCDKQRITDMLQLGQNGDESPARGPRNLGANRPHRPRRREETATHGR